MSQSGFTPILIYASGTASNTPLAANLTSGASGAELALNYADGKLFYKDSGGTVQVLATKGTGPIGGSNTQVQYNSSGSLAGSANLTFDGTTLTAAGLSGPHNGTVGATTPNTGAFTTLTASSSVTLSGGTANGVVYLNGSKVVTTGSALTFDGTNLGIGQTAPAAKLDLGTTVGKDVLLVYGGGSGSQYGLGISGALLELYTSSSGSISFNQRSGASYSELMRLTSTGLGIGTSSPAYKLSVNTGAAGVLANFTDGIAQTFRITTGSGFVAVDNPSAGALAFQIAGTERMRLDTSGNLGIGTSSPVGNLNVNTTGNTQLTISAGSTGLSRLVFQGQVSNNRGFIDYDNTSSVRAMIFRTNENEAMRLDSSGNLGLTKLALNSDTPFITGANISSGTNSLALGTTGSSVLHFFTNNAERARIDSSGNLLVGTTSATSGGGVVQVSNGITFPATQSASSNANTLDDYKEGTWTPADASGAGLTFTSVSASYTKIGNVVTVSAKLTYPTTADASQAKISGLPYAPAVVANIVFCNPGTTTSGAGQGYVDTASTTMILVAQNNASKTNANLSTLVVYFSGQYLV